MSTRTEIGQPVHGYGQGERPGGAALHPAQRRAPLRHELTFEAHMSLGRWTRTSRIGKSAALSVIRTAP